MSSIVMSFGAVCFGATIGFLTYRTVIRSGTAQISDITTVIAAVGGAAVTGIFDPSHGDLFGWYAIGLAAGLIVYISAFALTNDKQKVAAVLAAKDISEGHAEEGTQPDRPRR